MSDALKSNGDPRDFLANERTYLAWLRTGLATIGLGFIVARFALVISSLTGLQLSETGYHLSSITGIALTAIGALMVLLSFRRFANNQQRIRAGNYEATTGGELVLSLVIFVIALVLIADLILTV